ncbi:MAG: aldo/keto reductase, partial [Hyphomicrobium sp.]|nr:aldo/keto reductase [Hyphomicrobium sp.]
MQKRKLGRSNLEIAPLIFGGNVFGWTVDEKGSFALLDAFLDAGFNCIDTADVYSRWVPGHKGGESEAIIGNWFKARGKRSKVILATKCGLEMAPDKKGLSKAYIVRAVEESLKRLQTDYIDLYQSHRDDPATPLEETMAAHAELVKAGKVRVVGASNYSADRLKAALAASAKLGIPRYETLQPNYNLADRGEFEGALQDLCVAEG